jgi:hypothetical protein
MMNTNLEALRARRQLIACWGGLNDCPRAWRQERSACDVLKPDRREDWETEWRLRVFDLGPAALGLGPVVRDDGLSRYISEGGDAVRFAAQAARLVIVPRDDPPSPSGPS